ncbi:MAG TPA: hypothetical protein ENF73_04215 [Proteobacteria bacterium]|nr:hypothetical protein [Pseudomonadota bacterium]
MASTQANPSASVLFVHPNSDLMYPCELPLSVPALIKRIPADVFGCYGRELSADAVRKCQVVLIDVHWYHQLKEAVRLAERIKRVNPDAHIVAGGLTASLYAHILAERYDFD